MLHLASCMQGCSAEFSYLPPMISQQPIQEVVLFLADPSVLASVGEVAKTYHVQQVHNTCLYPCRDRFAEFSYLRAADKKQATPEHMEKVVLFLADAAALASPIADAKDWQPSRRRGMPPRMLDR